MSCNVQPYYIIVAIANLQMFMTLAPFLHKTGSYLIPFFVL